MLPKNSSDLFASRGAVGEHRALCRTDRTGDEGRASGDLACLAGDLDRAAVDVADPVADAKAIQTNAVSAEGVGFDDVGTGSEVRLVHRADQLRFRQVQVIEALVDANARAVEHGAHGAVDEEHSLGESLQEWVCHGSASFWESDARVSAEHGNSRSGCSLTINDIPKEDLGAVRSWMTMSGENALTGRSFDRLKMTMGDVAPLSVDAMVGDDKGRLAVWPYPGEREYEADVVCS